MIVENLCEFYCLNYNNKERKESMMERFNKLDISCNFYEGVGPDDIRMNNSAHTWSCMYGHLDMIHQFYYNTNKEFGIFCEDDVMIHKNFKNYLPKIFEDFKLLNLDVLLLGYLLCDNIRDGSYNGYTVINNELVCYEEFPYKYYNYPDDCWGTQMYLLSRENAKKILDKYYIGYAEQTRIENNNLTPFSADWIITKDGNRALLYPLIVIEDGKKTFDHHGQNHHHYYSYFNNYIEGEFI